MTETATLPGLLAPVQEEEYEPEAPATWIRLTRDISVLHGLCEGARLPIYEGVGCENTSRIGQVWVQCPRVPLPPSSAREGARFWPKLYSRIEPSDYEICDYE